MSMSEGRPQPMERFQTDRLAVEIHENRKKLGAAAARDMAARMRELLSIQPRVRIVFASAPSQNEFLAELSATEVIDWSRVEAFHMDEYVGLGTEHPQSFSKFLVDSLFSRRVPQLFHPLNGLAGDPEEECRRYTELLKDRPIDIVCAGIGENGHLAFNDPPVADFDDPKTVKVVMLTRESREQQVHDACFPGLEEVPTHALTLTVPALLAAANIYCMVPGPTKAAAVKETLMGPVSTACPATALRNHADAIFYLDRDSAAGYLAER